MVPEQQEFADMNSGMMEADGHCTSKALTHLIPIIDGWEASL
jgi:hypothetical protein